MFEKQFTIEEIQIPIWNCGNDKTLGAGSFAYKFLKNYREIFKVELYNLWKDFEESRLIGKGCNSSFTSLISKIPNHLYIKDYRPINLLECMYKILSKILDLRLKKVLRTIISQDQSMYMEGQSILDGSLLIDEIYTWAKKVKSNFLFLSWILIRCLTLLIADTWILFWKK